MFVTVYDAQRLISLSIHVDAPLTDKEREDTVALIHRIAADGAAIRKPTTVIVLVETDHSLNARDRKAIADAARAIEKGYQVIVTTSKLARMVMTAFEWLRPSTSAFHQSVHASYEEARAWLVARTEHSAEVLDVLHSEARQQLATRLARQRGAP